MFSTISVDGVPGYADANFIPASQAPLAIASLPDKRTLLLTSAASIGFLSKHFICDNFSKT